MATNEHVTDWTSTGSCTPAGTDTIGTSLDDELRMIKATIYSTSRMRVQAKSANYTSTISDHATLIAVTPSTATLSVSLAAAATMQDGGWLAIANKDDTYPVIIDPNGTETLLGSTTYSLQPGERIVLASNDVDGWEMIAAYPGAVRPGEWVLIETQTLSAASFADFTSILPTRFRKYRLDYDAIVNDVSGLGTLWVRVGDGTLETTGYDEVWFGRDADGTDTTNDNTNQATLDLAENVSDTAAEGGVNGRCYIWPTASGNTLFDWKSTWRFDFTGRAIHTRNGSGRNTANLTEMDYIRLSPGTGTISGTVTLYGMV